MRSKKCRHRRSSRPCSQRLSFSWRALIEARRLSGCVCVSSGSTLTVSSASISSKGPARPASQRKSPASFRQIAGNSITGRFASPVRPPRISGLYSIPAALTDARAATLSGPVLLRAWTCQSLLPKTSSMPQTLCLEAAAIACFPFARGQTALPCKALRSPRRRSGLASLGPPSFGPWRLAKSFGRGPTCDGLTQERNCCLTVR